MLWSIPLLHADMGTELKDVYNTEWTTTLINISTNEQKKVGPVVPIQIEKDALANNCFRIGF